MITTATTSVLITLLIFIAWINHCKLETPDHKLNKYVKRNSPCINEQVLYWHLVNALPGCIILTQVSMMRCIAGHGPHVNMLAHECFDFIICNQSMRIMAAIEIDSPPINQCRKTLDKLKEEALNAANICLIKCTPNVLQSKDYIAIELNQHTNLLTCFTADLLRDIAAKAHIG